MTIVIYKETFEGYEFIIGNDFFWFDGIKILFNEIKDFNYTHSYYNKVGGFGFTIYGEKEKIRLQFNHDGNFKKTESKAIIEKVEKLTQKIYPIIINQLLKNYKEQIISGKTIKVCKCRINADNVYMRQRVFLWLREICIPIKDCQAISRRSKRRYNGVSNVFFLINSANHKEYRYTWSDILQPSPMEVSILENLINFLKN